MGSLFGELKRRNVFKVAVAYIVVGWVVLQVADTITPLMNLPEWAGSTLLFFMIAGFPIAILFSWIFELTPEGLKKQTEVDQDASITVGTGRKIDFIIIGFLVLAIGGLVWDRQNTSDAPVQTAEAEKTKASIAVLPFVNMSSDPEQEYFSDGISEEILNVLAKTPNLHITSRSSAFQFKGDDIHIPTVAKKLGVDHVLEGSVRKSGTTVRITAQLIQADGDKHLWSETYDRDISDIFAVQDEISAAIVAALKEKLGLEINVVNTKSVSINPEAFDHYLHGQQSFKLQTFASFDEAEVSFKAALAIEPSFQAARVALALTYQNQIGTGSRTDPALLDEAETLLNIVLAAEPNNARAYFTLALVEQERRNNAGREVQIKKAYSLNPNDADIITQYARMMWAELGEAKTRALFADAQMLDPLNSNILYIKGGYFMLSLQAYDEAEAAFIRAFELSPKDGTYPANLGWLHGYRMGDIASAVSDFILTHDLDPFDPDSAITLSKAYLALGVPSRALVYADQAISISAISGQAIETRVTALMALGRKDEALQIVKTAFSRDDVFHRRNSRFSLALLGIRLLYDNQAYSQAEDFIFTTYPGVKELDYTSPPQGYHPNVFASTMLAALYRATDREQQAKRITDLNKSITEDILLGNKKKLMGVDYYFLAITGMGRLSDDKVIDYLTATIDNGFLMDWRRTFERNIVFLPLHDHPRYIALVNRIEAEMARQLALVKQK